MQDEENNVGGHESSETHADSKVSISVRFPQHAVDDFFRKCPTPSAWEGGFYGLGGLLCSRRSWISLTMRKLSLIHI